VVLSIIDPEFRPYSFAFFFIPYFALPFTGTKIGIKMGLLERRNRERSTRNVRGFRS